MYSLIFYYLTCLNQIGNLQTDLHSSAQKIMFKIQNCWHSITIVGAAALQHKKGSSWFSCRSKPSFACWGIWQTTLCHHWRSGVPKVFRLTCAHAESWPYCTPAGTTPNYRRSFGVFGEFDQGFRALQTRVMNVIVFQWKCWRGSLSIYPSMYRCMWWISSYFVNRTSACI